MAYIITEVDVDLGDFRTDDLLHECLRRIKNKDTRKELSNNIVKEFLDEIRVLSGLESPIKIESLDDQMKYEHLSKVFSKYNSLDIERLLPEKFS